MENIFWVDRRGHQYQANEISDTYLTNIAKALTKGVGDKRFLTPSKIQDLYKEVERRKLFTPYQCALMQAETLRLLHPLFELKGEY